LLALLALLALSHLLRSSASPQLAASPQPAASPQSVHAWTWQAQTPLPQAQSEECLWRKSRLAGAAPYHICLRTYDDLISNQLRNPASSGVYVDCKVLVGPNGWSRAPSTPGATFVDVGANIGSCTLLLASRGVPTISFEPNPSNLFYLTSSVKRNQFPVLVYPAAVANRSGGFAKIFHQRGNAGNSVVGKAIGDDNSSVMTNVASVPLIALDDVLWPHGSSPPKVHMMKIDVQGYEVYALQGAKRMLNTPAARPKVIWFEMASKWLRAAGTPPSALWDVLNAAGYEIYTREEPTKRVPRQRFSRYDVGGATSLNCYAVPRA